NEKRLEIEKEIFDVASSELKKLGFTLDSIKIEEIKDAQGYLEAIGRKKNAVVKRDARITELEAEAETAIAESNSKEKAEKAKYESLKKVAEYETDYRNYAASLNEKTYRNEVKAEFAKKQEELEQAKKIEELKIEVNTKKYNAEVVIPAEAEKKKLELIALGKAAELKEKGFAMADAVKKMSEEWDKGNTKELFMIHILPDIVHEVSNTIAEKLKIEKLVVLGDGIPKHVGSVAGSVISFIEQIKSLTGVDLTKIIEKKESTPVKKELE
ncbi:MAG: SPFH domain-containing protein, partial [bacterium]|nr:SPFH domain-containing protein [bacterium]